MKNEEQRHLNSLIEQLAKTAEKESDTDVKKAQYKVISDILDIEKYRMCLESITSLVQSNEVFKYAIDSMSEIDDDHIVCDGIGDVVSQVRLIICDTVTRLIETCDLDSLKSIEESLKTKTSGSD